jgi:hypothetical protein
MRRLIVAMLAAACLAGAGPAAAEEPAVGEIVSSTLELGPLRVALPPGKWNVIAEHSGRASSSDGAPTGTTYKGLYLVQYDQDKRFISSFYARATLPGGRPVEWRDKTCEREDTLHRAMLGGPAHSQDCVLVNHLVRFFQAKPREFIDRDAHRWLESNDIKLPKTVIEVRERFFKGADYLWVNYTVNPEIVDFVPSTVSDWRQSEWHPNFVKTDPERLQYVERLKSWVMANAKVHQAALRDNDKKGQIGPWPR